MTPRELQRSSLLLSFSSFFFLVGRVRAFLAGRAHPIQKSFPFSFCKDRDKLS